MHASPADLIIGLAMWVLPIAALILVWMGDLKGRQRPSGQRTSSSRPPR